MNNDIVLCLMSLFVLKHFIVDFPLQTQWMVDEKGTYGRLGGILHSWLHGVATALVLIPFVPGNEYGMMLAVILGLLDGVIHYHVDWAKMNLWRNFTINDRMYWTLLGIDQMLHYLTYLLIIWILTQ